MYRQRKITLDVRKEEHALTRNCAASIPPSTHPLRAAATARQRTGLRRLAQRRRRALRSPTRSATPLDPPAAAAAAAAAAAGSRYVVLGSTRTKDGSASTPGGFANQEVGFCARNPSLSLHEVSFVQTLTKGSQAKHKEVEDRMQHDREPVATLIPPDSTPDLYAACYLSENFVPEKQHAGMDRKKQPRSDHQLPTSTWSFSSRALPHPNFVPRKCTRLRKKGCPSTSKKGVSVDAQKPKEVHTRNAKKRYSPLQKQAPV